MSKILIIDSGMRNMGGHNFSYTRAVQSALAAQGFETDVLANRNLLEELAKNFNYQPTFAHGAYDFPPNKGIKTVLEYIYAQSIIYCNELEQFFENSSSEYAAVFCHTIMADFELIGWSKFLARNKFTPHLFLLLRNASNFRRMSYVKRKFHPYLRIKPYYLNAIYSKTKGRFTLLTDSEQLTNDYAAVFKHRIATLPIPINKYFLDQKYADDAASLENFKSRFGLND